MGKDWLSDIAPFAAMAALPMLAPGTTAAAGTGLLGTTPAASLPYGAFGSEAMAAQMAGPALLPEATAALATPAAAAHGTIETAGLDFINGVPQNMGARFESLLGDFTDGFKPDSMLKMLNQQPQQQQTRPAAITRQVKPIGKNAPETVVDSPYSQPNIGEQQYLTPEEMWKRELLRQQRGY